MTDIETKALKARDKREVTTPTEQTKPGPLFTPAVDIFETDQEITVLADMPGVKSKVLNIDLRDNILTLDGEVEPPEGKSEVDVFREYQSGKYSRQFSLSQVIDQANIDAELKDGVLRLRLPKVEAATPRKIAVKAV
ncbi:MAG: Hsp20/alpha crystallin family protein [Deltaproteobacteria bacterium]|nr:Hsp20/alpha crystallin family protein [Deltaproteobacteria bacterium]